LIADEQRAIREILTQLLTDAGFEALAPLEAYEAINLVARNPIVAFVSLDFKDESWSIAHFIREIKGRNPNARVYGMTGFGTQEKISTAIACGADGVLLKPFKVEEIEALSIAARDDAPAPPIL
jgi:DNA-binding NtrC family response regulator